MIIDPKNNLLSTLLAGAIGLLILLALVLFLVLGRVNMDRIAAQGESGVAAVAVAVPETGLEAFDEYNEIFRRPLFFSDRRLPVLQASDFTGEEFELVEDLTQDEPVPELNAKVAGIIITPDMRMAMIRDQGANRTLVLREGMSLEGDQAAWRLDRIEARMVNFVSVDGRSADLELEVNTRGLTRPASATPAAASPAEPEESEAEMADVTATDDDARTRAEEIRRRVAERRAELRAEAERRAQQRQDNQ